MLFLAIKGENTMHRSFPRRYWLSCRELGIDDDFVCYGKTKSDVIIRMLRYVRRVHGLGLENLWGYKVRQVNG